MRVLHAIYARHAIFDCCRLINPKNGIELFLTWPMGVFSSLRYIKSNLEVIVR